MYLHFSLESKSIVISLSVNPNWRLVTRLLGLGLYGWKEGEKHRWYNNRKQTTLLKFDRPQRNAEHPTMKPIPLIGYLINNSSKKDDIVFDFFLGSGTTLIAAEQLDRRCFGCELDPKYCDVIVDRYRKYKMHRNEPCNIKLNGEDYA